MISIHALLAESDRYKVGEFVANPDFYPRSPCGERPYGRINDISRLIFLSTLSLRRATHERNRLLPVGDYFYPRSPCGERQKSGTRYRHCRTISIHALLAESDANSGPCNGRLLISIHALLAESDEMSLIRPYANLAFLSTLSLRRATCNSASHGPDRRLFLSTLSLRRATSDAFAAVSTLLISIHALLAESDSQPYYTGTTSAKFLSTLSLRRATSPNGGQYSVYSISIHALLAESDTRTQSASLFA